MSSKPVPPRPGRGASRARLAEILRVDHAGELAAVQIYRGQRAVLERARGQQALAGHFAEMEAQEAEHLARFDKLLTERRVRPTALTPLWRIAGFALGAGTALLGEKAAHACTEAVETVIEGHYADQIAELAERDPGLAAELTRFRDDELAHRDHAVEAGAREAPGYGLLSAVIGAGCRAAIRISEKL
ncbi:demethoxyubiquinone hydroxylase family protein [Phenylobacterium sp.]|uniref:demethoxyubiquinone hydroxylase family protein n=1 Tax=Phenylobacterium sp. TaxID=1871053 RepID=UPI0025CC502B|nr:demethoxyubiquinone hydroxylase family protein [Phenylobacterium sp.]MBX3483383.1 demethoxyubiquinone hydroxylase family protein [Phenylobacterium sp.]MCW5760534.1 demethoxyubiquinone hydroxylase family protein [Phenylobacterium sp.]